MKGSLRSRTRAILSASSIVSVMAASCASAATAPLQQTLRQPGGGQYHDEFGQSVATDRDTVVVGAPGAGSGSGPFTSSAPGAAFVFVRSGNEFHETAVLTASDGAAGDGFGASVAIDGDEIVVGAPGRDGTNASNRGAAYTFARTGAASRHETALLDSPLNPGSDLGASVAIDGNRIVAGAPEDQTGYIVVWTATGASGRLPIRYLSASDLGALGLGSSVAIDGDAIVGGAPFSFDGRDQPGAAYTFDRTATDVFGHESARLAAPVGAAGFGASVAIHDSRIVVGAPSGSDGGSALLFTSSGASPRSAVASLRTKTYGDNGSLASSVAIDGSSIVAGAPSAGDHLEGEVYEFPTSGSASRTPSEELLATDTQHTAELGSSVALGGDTIVAGAPTPSNTDDSIGFATVFFADEVAPKTQGLRGPKKVEQGVKAKFRFRSNEKGSSFECRVDDRKALGCRSPYGIGTRGLKPGKHTFRVYAIDPAGNKDRTPAKTSFRVKP